MNNFMDFINSSRDFKKNSRDFLNNPRDLMNRSKDLMNSSRSSQTNKPTQAQKHSLFFLMFFPAKSEPAEALVIVIWSRSLELRATVAVCHGKSQGCHPPVASMDWLSSSPETMENIPFNMGVSCKFSHQSIDHDDSQGTMFFFFIMFSFFNTIVSCSDDLDIFR